ncbi:MAG: NAD(P)H-hydrate dehydratase [Pseudomonadota bacterium]
MSELPAKIYSVSAVRHFDRCAIEREGIAGATLMSRAGAYAYRSLLAAWPDVSACVVVCGGGNNAGDGYVIARLAMADQRLSRVIALSNPASLTGDAATAYEAYVNDGGRVDDWNGDLPGNADLIVDALLGSGLERAVEGRFAEAVAAINASKAPTVAIDLPSGLHGDSGEVMGCAVAADMTVTFVGLKSGLYLGQGPALCGELRYSGLDIPPHCRDSHKPVLHRVGREHAEGLLPPRRADAHKGDFGHVLVVGGGPGMPGAARLCAEAALRTGAGRVTVAAHPDSVAATVASRPEIMVHGVESGADLAVLTEAADVIAFGPGLGQSAWARGLFDALENADVPAVWDADALNGLAARPSQGAVRVLTPHPGEAARLLGTTPADVQGDRLGSLTSLLERFAGTVVLKGARTLVGDGDRVQVCDAGNPGMATAGMGDVLTGVIAGLMSQGMPAAAAARTGVLVHALAGDRAAAFGQRGLIASDLFPEIRRVVNT